MDQNLNPFRKAQPRISAFDDTDRRTAGFDAWQVWINAGRLATLPDKDFGDEAQDYMRKAIEVLTEKLERMK